MKTNGSSAKSQEIGSKRKWKNQHEHTAKQIAWHSFGYQGHYPQQRPARDGASLTPLPGRQNDFHVSGDRFFLTSSPYQQDLESRYIQDKMNGVITCLVCGSQGHYSSECHFKDQEHKIICAVCSKNGHCSMWCCQQNKLENRACTRCGEIGHTTSTHGLGCSSCDEYHDDGECRLSQVKCFICECQDHYLAQCPLNSVLTEAFQGQRRNLQAALRLALSKQRNPSSTPAKYYAKSEGEVLTANKSSPICFTCREEGHYACMCPQKLGAISGNTSKELEESSTIPTSSNMSKVLEEQGPGTAKHSSDMKWVVRCVSCGQEGHRARSCPTRVFICSLCNEEGHKAKKCPQKGQKSSEMKRKSNVRCVRCGLEGHRRKTSIIDRPQV
ncbi:unnamed protein product [Triticum turgidum subsp. durum]|uniref:CCHC-type domain-containing protein n=1 Tax=Triticum turgidum subsp. durum TaxID=4567 RepID=A0A9R0WZ64_TRITD|nr:unnamed protein product [Triticum turgidum subsp. durum]